MNVKILKEYIEGCLFFGIKPNAKDLKDYKKNVVDLRKSII